MDDTTGGADVMVTFDKANKLFKKFNMEDQSLVPVDLSSITDTIDSFAILH